MDAKFARIYWSGKGTDLSPDPDTPDRAIMDAIPWLTFSCVVAALASCPLGGEGELLPGANRLDLRDWRCAWRAAPSRGSAEWLARGSRMRPAQGEPRPATSELLLKRLGYTPPIGDAPAPWRWI